MCVSGIYYSRFYQKGITSQRDCNYNPGNALVMEGQNIMQVVRIALGMTKVFMLIYLLT